MGKIDWIHDESNRIFGYVLHDKWKKYFQPSLVNGPLAKTVSFDSRNGKPADAQPIDVPYDTERRFEHKVT